MPEDIRDEFYVKSDGGVRAKTLTALSRLAGIHKSTLLDRLLPRVFKSSAEMLPTTLKPLAGMDLRQSAEIDEKIISCVINYYAWESEQASNDTAKQVALIFNAIGIRAYFQSELGWEDPSKELLARMEASNVLMEERIAKLTVIAADMFARHDALMERMNVVNDTHDDNPGIKQTVNNYTRRVIMLPAELPEPFSIRDYVLHIKKRRLSRGECISIGRFVCGSLTTFKFALPGKDGTKRVYRHADILGLDAIYQAWLETYSG